MPEFKIGETVCFRNRPTQKMKIVGISGEFAMCKWRDGMAIKFRGSIPLHVLEYPGRKGGFTVFVPEP